MPAPPVGGADAVDMGGGGCTMAGGAAALGVPPSGAVRGSAFFLFHIIWRCSWGAPWWAPWQVLGMLGVLHLPAVLPQPVSARDRAGWECLASPWVEAGGGEVLH